MAKIIRNGKVEDDGWTCVRLAAGGNPATLRLPPGSLLVPAAVWRARRRELIERQYAHGDALGVWLGASEGPEAIVEDIDDFSVIGVEFSRFSDGRGYSTARLLRTRYGYGGELRAIGDVLRDQMFYLRRVGFDAFAVRADKSVEQALRGLADFSVAYQGGADAALLRRETASLGLGAGRS